VRTEFVTISQRDLSAIDQALACVEGLVAKQDAEDRFQVLTARVDVLRLQIYIVQDIVRSLFESSGQTPRRSCDSLSAWRGVDRRIA
jgi:hypothetical protein